MDSGMEDMGALANIPDQNPDDEALATLPDQNTETQPKEGEHFCDSDVAKVAPRHNRASGAA